jgi:ABC-type transport system substrate-binding protein
MKALMQRERLIKTLRRDVDMSRCKRPLSKVVLVISLLPLLLVAVACGTAAPAEPEPGVATTAAPVAEATPAQAAATAAPTVAPTSTPLPPSIVSARDRITLAVNSEPTQANIFLSLGGPAPMFNDNLVDPWTWHSGDDLRVVPTTATESWEQLAPDKWRFQLRQGVKFHNGEVWNAQAAMPSLDFQGTLGNGNSSSQNTGAFKAAAVGEYTVEITCANSCPIFPKTAIFLDTQAPNFYSSSWCC